MIRIFAYVLLLLTVMPSSTMAQEPLFQMPDFKPPQTRTSDKNCINVTNNTLRTINGDFISDKYEKDSEWGRTKVSNRYRFRIKKNETQAICIAGPYFSGPSIEFIIRRAWPVFRCKARLGQDLKVVSIVTKDNIEKFSANCF